MSKFPAVTRRVLRMIESYKARRRVAGYDIFAVVEEPIRKLTPHTALEAIDSIYSSASRAVGNDCLFRFIQVGFGSTEILLDIPNTTISATEAEFIIRSRSGFFFERERTQEPSNFNPLQKIYRHGDEADLADDIAYIFVEVWHHPAEIPLELQFD